MYCKDRRGVLVPDQEEDLRCNITQGYLRKEGAGRVMKGGVLHRGPVGASNRGRAGVGVGGRKKGRRQAAVLPREQGGAGRPTQAQRGSRESPARTEKRAQQRERPATPTQAPRPAPGISLKIRPKNRAKEGWMSMPRAAPRPTRAPGSGRASGLPGQGRANIFFQTKHTAWFATGR